MDEVDDDVRAVVLVEGLSDRVALEALAATTGRDLTAAGVAIVAMGGATNISRYLEMYRAMNGPGGRRLRVGGLCDAGEEPAFRRRLARAGLGEDSTRPPMEQFGLFVCDVDLEDELIRALGVDAVERVIEQQGELASLRIMQRQPAQRGRAVEQQLRRFIGTRSGRKVRYGQLLVEALPPDRVPTPLTGVLDWVTSRLPS
ncbi:MAG TPA: ATP-dependent endonuclease [Ilumatobacter sp.]|nr:ATP-dependent endonuclease [Ilumatobacter sp.]